MEIESERTAAESAKRVAELELECDKLEGEKMRLKEEVVGMKGKEGRLKEKYGKLKGECVKMEEGLDSEKRKRREEGERLSVRYWKVEAEKSMLGIDFKAAEDEVQRLKSLLEERDALVTHLLGKVEDFERRNCELESGLQAQKMRLQELEKARISELLDHKSFLEEEDAGVRNIGKELVASQENKKVMGNENSESSAMDSECQKSSHVADNEAQKESSDLAAIELKGDNGQASSSNMLCNAKGVLFSAKSKDSDNIQISEGSNNGCDDRIITRCTTKEVGNLSHEGMECTPVVASQTIAGSPGNSIVPQKRKVEALGCSVEKQIGTEKFKSSGTQSDSGITCTPPFASQSNNVEKQIETEQDNFGGHPDAKLKQIETTQANFGGHSNAKLKWESASKMFNALTANHELCISSVCALYRKHKSLGNWKNGSSFSNRGFKLYETRGMALGELLTNGDPESVMKKSLAEFREADPLGLDDCRLIARHHHKELFQIYKNNLDPLFTTDERI